jgi:hypothetical protein
VAVKARALAFAHKDVEGLAWNITLPVDELAVECQARELSERERQEQSEELTLMQT